MTEGFQLGQIPRVLNKRVRIKNKYSIRLWFILFCTVIPILTLIKISRSGTHYNTTSTIIDLEMDESLLTSEQLAQLPIPLRAIRSKTDKVFQEGCRDTSAIDPTRRANAALVVLSRNKELEGVIKSIESLERHFNQWFQYPWIFLNDEEHTAEFKETVAKYTGAKVSFGTIPKEQWDFPESHMGVEFQEHIVNQGDRGIMYGQLESYHKMCRFYSKFFFKHELVKNLEWYWRVEPDVEFYCDLTYDPFLEMQAQGKKYAFTVMIRELIDTVPNLFRYTKTFLRENKLQYSDAWKLFIKDLNFYGGKDKDRYRGVENVPDLIRKIEKEVRFEHMAAQAQDDSELDDGLLADLVKKNGPKGLTPSSNDMFEMEEYNLCHFWSNFEIARTDLFNNEVYDQYIDFLENSGGFYRERWGDAPIHSLAVGILLNLTDIHYFRDIGYKHSTLGHCPNNAPQNQLPYSPPLESRYAQTKYKPDPPVMNGVGCRCKCPANFIEIENSGGSCMGQWINLTKQPPKSDKLDVDKIKLKIKEMYESYLGNAGEEKDWYLSESDIRALSKQRLKG